MEILQKYGEEYDNIAELNSLVDEENRELLDNIEWLKRFVSDSSPVESASDLESAFGEDSGGAVESKKEQTTSGNQSTTFAMQQPEEQKKELEIRQPQ